MRIRTTVVTVLTLGTLLIGCMPMSERVVKKEQQDPAWNDSTLLAEAQIEQEAKFNRSIASLDPVTRNILHSYGRIIKEFAERYGFDWRLVLAVIKTESGFATTAVSPKGAYGLMQIMPVTSVELARMLELESLAHPVDNIHGGIYYMRQLYNLFGKARPSDRIRLMLAAYNAGIGRIYDAQELVTYFNGNPLRWSAVREALPLLSRDYCSLHQVVWSGEHPRTGWFGNSQETLAYVDRIMSVYDQYCLALK